jgi:hypothetical protein
LGPAFFILAAFLEAGDFADCLEDDLPFFSGDLVAGAEVLPRPLVSMVILAGWEWVGDSNEQ